MSEQLYPKFRGVNRDVAEISIAAPKLDKPTEQEWKKNDEFIVESYRNFGIDIRETLLRVRNGTLLINPTRDEVRDVCRQHGVEPPPWPIAEGVWRSPIFMSASEPEDWQRQKLEEDLEQATGVRPPPPKVRAGANSEPQQQQQGGSANSAKMEPLTFRRLNEILAMEFDDADFVLRNGYLTKGDPAAICGAGGIGKSRLVSQLVRDMLLGQPFLGRWVTNGQDLNVMVLQSENSNRRMKSDLWAQCIELTQAQKDHIHEHCVWHTLENSDDSFLTLASDENQQRIEEAIAFHKPDLVVWDVLRDFAVDDPNSDKFMQQSLSIIGRLTRKYNSQCIALVLQHARTGKAGAATATGYDRASFGRNSKVLFSWTRSQINVAAYGDKDNDVLIIASGKCNNAEEFKPFAVRLNKKTMSYEVDESITEEDIAAWHEEMGAGSGIKKKQNKKKTKKDFLDLVPDPSDIALNSLIVKAADAGIGEKRARAFLGELVDDDSVLFIHHKKRSGMRDEKRVSRYPEIPAEDSEQTDEQNASK